MLSALAGALRRAPDAPAPLAPFDANALDAHLAKLIAANRLEAFADALRGLCLRAPSGPSSAPGPLAASLPQASLALAEALQSPDLAYLDLLLKAGAHPDALAGKQDTHSNPLRGQRLLHRAASLNCPGAIWALMAAGADPALRDRGGRTALIIASASGHRICAEALIETGSPLDSADHSGRSALDCALTHHLRKDPISRARSSPSEIDRFAQGLAERAPIAMALLLAGADAGAPNHAPRSVGEPRPLPYLACALRLQNLSLFRSLLQNGANPAWLLEPQRAENSPIPSAPDDPQALIFWMTRRSDQRALIERAKLIASTQPPKTLASPPSNPSAPAPAEEGQAPPLTQPPEPRAAALASPEEISSRQAHRPILAPRRLV